MVPPGKNSVSHETNGIVLALDRSFAVAAPRGGRIEVGRFQDPVFPTVPAARHTQLGYAAVGHVPKGLSISRFRLQPTLGAQRAPGAARTPTLALRDTPRAMGPWRAHNSVHISVHLQVDRNMD